MLLELQIALATLTADLEGYKAQIEPPQVVMTLTVEELVRREFADAPIMIEVARCESQFRQHDQTGQTLKGKANPKDKGVFQINERWHPQAVGLIETAEGNIKYARSLYESQGTRPWEASKACWDRNV